MWFDGCFWVLDNYLEEERYEQARSFGKCVYNAGL